MKTWVLVLLVAAALPLAAQDSICVRTTWDPGPVADDSSQQPVGAFETELRRGTTVVATATVTPANRVVRQCHPRPAEGQTITLRHRVRAVGSDPLGVDSVSAWTESNAIPVTTPVRVRRAPSAPINVRSDTVPGVVVPPPDTTPTPPPADTTTPPPTTGVAFFSDWRGGTPSDGGKWIETDSPNSISVVTTQSVGGTWPTGMTHALRVAYNSGNSSSVSAQHQWPLPATGQYLFRRLGMRVNVDSFGNQVADHHPVQSMGVGAGTCAYAAAYQLFHRAADYQLQISNLNTADPGGAPTYRWELNQRLAVGTYYQIEERYQRIANDRYKVAIRVYDAAGTTVYTESDFADAWNNAGSLATVMSPQGSAYIVSGNGDHGETCLRSFNIGNQGRNYGATEYIYYGGFAARISANANDWLGPYR